MSAERGEQRGRRLRRAATIGEVGGYEIVPPTDPRPQMKFAHFEFNPETDRLGEGPLSEVYRAVDSELGRTVALKILRAHAEIDPSADQRFHREARHISNLDHANIATVYEYGKDQGTSYIAMEYLEGNTLDKILKEQTLGYEECQRIALQVTSALSHVHRAELIHRDLKPGNIMVLHDGTVKLLDFGIARASNESSITQHGMLVGTVLYMAPEQVRGDELEFRSDIFALGAVLYQMMTGALPFPGKSFPEVCMAILDGKPRRPSLVRSGFPPPLEEFILRCLDAEPKNRFPSAEEAHGALMSTAELTRSGSARAGKVEGKLIIPPIVAAGSSGGDTVAAGLRKDLASELARIQGLEVSLIKQADPSPGLAFDYVLRAELELEMPHGRLDLAIQRFQARNGSPDLQEERHDHVEQQDPDEWTLQADLVRGAARTVRRRLTEFSLNPSAGTGRNVARSRELTDTAHSRLLRGTTKHLMGAISQFRRAIDADPYCAGAYAGLAEALVRKFLYWDGDTTFIDEAREYAQRALALDPACAEAHCSLGFAYHLSGHHTDAQREYRVAIQLNEDTWMAHRLLGSILRRDGNFKDAAPHLSKAIELRPDHIGSYDHLVGVLRRLDRPEEAHEIARAGIEAAKDCLKGQADNQEARLHMALLLARDGSPKAAARCVERALEVAPKDGYTSFLAGCVFAVTGELDEATEHIKRAHDRGFYVRSELRNNEDLDLLRGLSEFDELLT